MSLFFLLGQLSTPHTWSAPSVCSYGSRPPFVNHLSPAINKAAADENLQSRNLKWLSRGGDAERVKRRGSVWVTIDKGWDAEKKRFSNARISMRAHWAAERMVLKDRRMGTQIGANYVNSGSKPFFFCGNVSIENGFHVTSSLWVLPTAVKPISDGVKLSNYHWCRVKVGLWRDSESCCVCGRSGVTWQGATWWLPESGEWLARNTAAHGSWYAQKRFTGAAQWAARKHRGECAIFSFSSVFFCGTSIQWFSLSEIHLCGFWCKTPSINDTLKSRWKRKKIMREWQGGGEEEKSVWNYVSATSHAAWWRLHQQNGLLCLGRKTNWAPVAPRALMCLRVSHKGGSRETLSRWWLRHVTRPPGWGNRRWHLADSLMLADLLGAAWLLWFWNYSLDELRRFTTHTPQKKWVRLGLSFHSEKEPWRRKRRLPIAE